MLNAAEGKSPLNDVEKAIINAIRSEDLRPRERQHTLQLFNMMLRLLKKSQLAESEQPYQSANLVRCLRNMLVHPKPGWVVTFSENPNENLSEQQQIVKQLRRDLKLDRDATFPRDILNSKCADWAVSSCESFLREFVKRSGVQSRLCDRNVKYWEIIGDNLSKAGLSWGCVSTIDSNGRTIWIADANRGDGKRLVVRADENIDRFSGTRISDSRLQQVCLTGWRIFPETRRR